MMNRYAFLKPAILLLCLGLSMQAHAAFRAFNDLGPGTNQLTSNITTYTNGSSGALVDYDTSGSTLGATVSITGLAVNDYFNNNILVPPVGSDAYTIFTNIVDWTGYTYMTNTGITLSFTHLSPDKAYQFVSFGARTYTTRFIVTTISEADAFTNNSSVGATIFTNTVANDSTKIVAQNDGLVASFTGINPGTNGTISFNIRALDSGDLPCPGYVSCFMLKEVDVPQAPSMANSSATVLGPTSATAAGNVVSTGSLPTKVWLRWQAGSDGGTTSTGWLNNADMGYQPNGALFTNLTGLTSNTLYYYRFHASNSMGQSWGSPVASFTTPVGEPAFGNMWRRGQVVGVMNMTNCPLYLYAQNSTGTVFVDDVSVVQGVVAESGANLITNPGFESGTSSWQVVGDHVASAVVSSPKRRGGSALRLQSSVAAAGGNSSSVKQTVTGLTSGGVYTISYWYMATNSVDFIVRFSSHPYLSTSVSVGPGGTTSNHPAAAPIKIMPIGDSITQSTTNYASYRYWLWKQLTVTNSYSVDFLGALTNAAGAGPNLYPDFDRDHAGYWGWAASEVDWALSTNGDYYAGSAFGPDTPGVLQTNRYYVNNPATVPDIALIHIGHNDVNMSWKGFGLTNATNNISVMIDHLRAKNPAMIVMLCKNIPVDAAVNPARAAEVDALAALIPTLAASKNTAASPVVVVDQNTGYNPATDNWILDGDGLPDGTHPNELGEKKMSATFFAALVPFLNDMDQNGLGDVWERRYFGATGVTTNADPDKDGLSNLQEFVAGCDPTRQSSQPELAFGGTLNGIPVWQVPTITQRTYTVEYRTNMATGSWLPHIMAAGTGNPLTITNSPDQNKRFYRYRVTQP